VGRLGLDLALETADAVPLLGMLGAVGGTARILLIVAVTLLGWLSPGSSRGVPPGSVC